MYVAWGKRLLDIALSALLIVVLSPVMALLALGVFIDLGWPILFVQLRPGLGGRPFKLFKFRTMRNLEGANLHHDGARVTNFGRLLRSLSLDELPELFNVLAGSMSLVGPRPLLLEYLPLYSPEQAKRHLVKPGLTGLAQVSGRNSVPWERRFELDCMYVRNCSLKLDSKILTQTILVVLTRRGINSPASDRSLPFEG